MQRTNAPLDEVLDIAHARLMCQRGVARALRVGAGLRPQRCRQSRECASEASVSRWETQKRGPSKPEVAAELGQALPKSLCPVTIDAPKPLADVSSESR